MKTLSFQGKEVKDLSGLYYDLLKERYAVENVGRGRDCTLVYLDEHEEKNPEALVDEWARRPAFVATRSSIEERRKRAIPLVEAARKEREAAAAARAAQEAARLEREAVAQAVLVPGDFTPIPAVTDPQAPAGQLQALTRVPLWKRVFKVFRSES